MPTTGHTRQFDGKVAFITGAGSGIGRGTALAFARHGATVAAVGLTEDRANETARDIQRAGGDALPIAVDVTDSAAVADAVHQTVTRFGRLDIAFNNAGVAQPPTPLAEEQFDRVLDVNL